MPEMIEDTSTVQLYADGTARFGIKILFSDAELDEARHGYRCFTACAESWANSDIPAWPDACPVCGSAENTPENFARLYQGVHVSGSQIDWDAEEERLHKQGWERDIAEGLRARGIFIP